MNSKYTCIIVGTILLVGLWLTLFQVIRDMTLSNEASPSGPTEASVHTSPETFANAFGEAYQEAYCEAFTAGFETNYQSVLGRRIPPEPETMEKHLKRRLNPKAAQVAGSILGERDGRSDGETLGLKRGWADSSALPPNPVEK